MHPKLDTHTSYIGGTIVVLAENCRKMRDLWNTLYR